MTTAVPVPGIVHRAGNVVSAQKYLLPRAPLCLNSEGKSQGGTTEGRDGLLSEALHLHTEQRASIKAHRSAWEAVRIPEHGMEQQERMCKRGGKEREARLGGRRRCTEQSPLLLCLGLARGGLGHLPWG